MADDAKARTSRTSADAANPRAANATCTASVPRARRYAARASTRSFTDATRQIAISPERSPPPLEVPSVRASSSPDADRSCISAKGRAGSDRRGPPARTRR